MKLKHTHNYKDYKELDVPNEKYMISKSTKLLPEDIEHGFIPSSVVIMKDKCLILYCTTCGEVKIKKLKI